MCGVSHLIPEYPTDEVLQQTRRVPPRSRQKNRSELTADAIVYGVVIHLSNLPDRFVPRPEDPLDLVAPDHLAAFREDLLAWYRQARRAMPWRETTDPYRIWLSEVLLQQTRVDQAQPYYERFLQAFPTAKALADAELDEVLRVWEGLGYYSRARNLHRAARLIVEQHGGRVPDDYEAIRALPGVGPYTAAAVLSIAYGRPHAVLDGNVMRVLTRVFAIDDEVDRSRTRRRLQTLADALLPQAHPADFNQALMELGATVCTPANPACPACPLQTVCRAYEAQAQDRYPVKRKKSPVPHYDIAVGLVFNAQGALLIQRRPEDKMLGGLWEFPGGKRELDEALEATCRRELREELGIEVDVEDLFARVNHAYSHFKITLHAFRCRIRSGTPRAPEGIPLRWVVLSDLSDYAFPRANRQVIEALLRRRQHPTLFDDSA